MKRSILTILILLLASTAGLSAKDLTARTDSTTVTAEADSLGQARMDGLFVDYSTKPINDYSLIGVNYGLTFSNMYFSPSKHDRAWVMNRNYVSVTYTRFSKMFDTLPYFALVIGAAMGNEGFTFKTDSETGEFAGSVDDATWCSIKVFEIPAMAQIHIDYDPLKLMANVGVYGGWRQSISRTGANLEEMWTNSFRDYENQFDYGLQGGAGFAIMLDPIEIHFNCLLRWSWSSLYDPDYYSTYYYRYAYPIDVMATVGIHYQLTKRRGRTRSQLKKEAYEYVYGATSNTSR